MAWLKNMARFPLACFDSGALYQKFFQNLCVKWVGLTKAAGAKTDVGRVAKSHAPWVTSPFGERVDVKGGKNVSIPSAFFLLLGL
jgi:hypothetical protein